MAYEWEGHKLELDETQFNFRTTCEIEWESVEPERIKILLEGGFCSRMGFLTSTQMMSSSLQFLEQESCLPE